jgi:hypothetical protein
MYTSDKKTKCWTGSFVIFIILAALFGTAIIVRYRPHSLLVLSFGPDMLRRISIADHSNQKADSWHTEALLRAHATEPLS